MAPDGRNLKLGNIHFTLSRNWPGRGSSRFVRATPSANLAEQHLGDGSKWPRIHRANADRIEDPDLIDIGWRLVIPARATGGPKPAVSRPARRVPPARPQVQQPAPSPDSQRPEVQPPQPSTGTSVTATTIDVSTTTDPAWPLIGGMSRAMAAMVLAGVGANRLNQLRARPLGRRINHPPLDVRHYETALGRRERPETAELLEKALRALGAHAHAIGRALPSLRWVTVDEVGVTFHWATTPDSAPADGFTAFGDDWVLTHAVAEALPHSTHPVPFPALVTLGRDPDGSWLMVDLESRSPLAITGSRALRYSAVAAMAVELSCSPWSSEMGVAVVGGDEMFIRAACPELVRFHSHPGPALDALEALVAERSADDSPTKLLRVDPDRAEAGAAQVMLFADELAEPDRTRLDDLCDDHDLGLAGVVAGTGDWVLTLSGTDTDASAGVEPDGRELKPQLIAAHTRAAIGTIFAATDEAVDHAAPWWSDADNVRTLVPRRETVEVNEEAAARTRSPVPDAAGSDRTPRGCRTGPDARPPPV